MPRAIMLTIGVLLAGMPGAADATNRPVLTVFAASSATDCLGKLGRQYEAAQNVQLKFNFASSSVLARQIEEGAPCDLFLSADQEWMDYLAKRARIQAATRRDLLGNRLAVVTPSNRIVAVRLEKGFDFPGAFAGRLAVGDPAHVPAGKYAKEALQQMGWWGALEKRLAPAENVRAALKLVERGECDAGIVYATDARAARGVAVVATFPADAHKPICYPVALCVGAGPAATPFLTFLSGPDAASVWTNAGFTVMAPVPVCP